MDPFDGLRAELAGSLMTMEFGAGGRVTQLWANDPTLPEEGEDFQFILPSVAFGEEAADDYLPGTILLGVRNSPDEPWVLGRNRTATRTDGGDDLEEFDPFSEEFTATVDPAVVSFRYDFPLIEGLEVTGKFYEIPGALPQIAWDVEIVNTGRQTIEIGELGFPLAFNNYYEGFGWTDDQLRRLWSGRVYIHKFIGGAASWLFAERMTAEAPGLLVFPAEGTGWEFFCHARSSLNTPYQWEGIPMVYVHSRATVEREEWPTWFNEHSSLILEPGDKRTFGMRFAPTFNEKHDAVHETLQLCAKPVIRLLPGAVAPTDVGIAVEVTGVAPKRFYVSRDAVLETDTDPEAKSGFCFVKPAEPGPLTLSFPDDQGKLCHVHLMFTSPIGQLIDRRAEWIAANQVVEAPGTLLHHAIALTNIESGQQVLAESEYLESSGLECAVADALFLAEKNALRPVAKEITVLDQFIEDFLLDDLQNPGTGAVASVIQEGAAGYFGRPMSYPAVMCLYHAASQIARHTPGLRRSTEDYLRLAARTFCAMFRYGWRLYVRSVGVLGYARVYELLEDLKAHGLHAEAEEVRQGIEYKASELTKLKFPFAGETVMDTSGFEEVFSAGKYRGDDDHLERTTRCAFATRSLAPSWWWYGSDKRHWDGGDASPLEALVDRGEACLSHTTIPNSLVFFGLLDRDYMGLPDSYMRKAFGGFLGPWALIRDDGAASMCYCPDLSSKQAGLNAFTGASGLGYFHYLRESASYVLPNRDQGTVIFGCHYVLEDGVHRVQPWDGVGRRVVLRQIGVEFRLTFGQLIKLALDGRRRWFEAEIHNPSSFAVVAQLHVAGLWGEHVVIEVNHERQRLTVADGGITAPLTLPPGATIHVRGEVTGDPNPDAGIR